MVFESFGFKYGVPHDADFIFDTRFLPNFTGYLSSVPTPGSTSRS